MTQKDSQEKMMELRVMESRLEGMTKQKEFISTRLAEIESTVKSIDEVSKADGEAMFHLGGEAFMPAKPVKDGKVIVMIGAEVAMKKTVEDAKKLLDSRKKEAEDVMKQIQNEIVALTKKLETAAMSLQTEGGK